MLILLGLCRQKNRISLADSQGSQDVAREG